MQLTLLQPGVTAQEGLNTVNKGLAGGSDISVSGGSTTSNLCLVDGADNVDHGSNRTILVYPSIDAIEEFKIQRNNYGAEFGGAGGAQVNLVTRGGTNSLHGSAYYYARRDALNSTDYFLKTADQDKQKLTWNDFGATLGGPIIKDKLHFFLSYEKNQDKKQEVRSALRSDARREERQLQRDRQRLCPQTVPMDPRDGPALPEQHDPGQPDLAGGRGAAEADARIRTSQRLRLRHQLHRGRRHAGRLAAAARSCRLEPDEQHPGDGALHAGQLEGDERQRRPVG